MTLGIQSATLINNIGGNPVILHFHSHECGREWSRSAKYLEKVHRNSRALRSELGRGHEKRFHWPLSSALTEELNQFEIAKSRIFNKVVNRFPFKTMTYDKLNLHTICCSGNEYAVQKKNKVQGITSDTRTNQGGLVGKNYTSDQTIPHREFLIN